MDRDQEHRDATGTATREELLQFHQQLSPEERRERFILAPAYRDHYNRLVQPDEMVGFPGSAYFWRKWVSILKPTAAAVYIVLRDIAYAHKNVPEDAWCYPDQAELAKMLGLSDRKTIRQHLNTLEQHGFMKREKDYRSVRDQEHGGKLARQRASVYHVYYEIPLVAEDAVTLLLLREGIANPLEINDLSSVRGNPPHRSGGKPSSLVNQVEGIPPPPSTYPQEATSVGAFQQEKPPTINVKSTNVYPTLDNVREQSSPSNVPRTARSSFKEDPRIASLSPLERAEKDQLVREIALRLNAAAGDHGNAEHKSAGLHRRIAYLMPAPLVHEALMATADAVQEDRAGRKSLRGSPAAYFTGIVRKIAEREGIDLGIKGWE